MEILGAWAILLLMMTTSLGVPNILNVLETKVFSMIGRRIMCEVGERLKHCNSRHLQAHINVTDAAFERIDLSCVRYKSDSYLYHLASVTNGE